MSLEIYHSISIEKNRFQRQKTNMVKLIFVFNVSRRSYFSIIDCHFKLCFTTLSRFWEKSTIDQNNTLIKISLSENKLKIVKQRFSWKENFKTKKNSDSIIFLVGTFWAFQVTLDEWQNIFRNLLTVSQTTQNYFFKDLFLTNNYSTDLFKWIFYCSSK